MRRLLAFAALVCAVVAVACGGGDDPTAPSNPSGPTAAPQPGGPNFATASNGAGLSITTDKDDYAPGDTVQFTGAGWLPGDTLDIVLTDDPQSHEPHRWWVLIDESGEFHDSTYVVDDTDLGVTFTLTAISRSNSALSLAVQFTDGTLQGLALAPLSVTVPVGTPAGYTITVDMAGNTNICTVTLSFAFNNPPGAPAGAVPTIGTPNPTTNATNVDFTRSLTINTVGVAPGTYPFTVTATGSGCGGSNRTIGGTLVVFGNATKLAFDQQPTDEDAAQPITPAVTVRVLDVANNVVLNSSAPVTVAIGTNPGGGTLTGTLTQNAVNGVATFPDLKINKVGNGYTLTAASGSLTGATSTAFEIKLGAPFELAFTSQPSGGTTGTAFPAQPAVEVRDAGGNRNTSGQGNAATIALAIVPGTGTAGAVLTCTTNPLGATNGLATFAGCRINLAGTNYRLRASTTIGGNPFTVDSDPFNVTAATAATSIAIVSSQNPSALGDPVTFTATVTTGSPAVPVTAGSVTFREGTCAAGTVLGGGPIALNGSGQAAFTTSTLTIGSHTIRACYGGTPAFLASENSVTQVVNNTATDIDLISSVNPSVTGQTVTFTATVTNNSNPVTVGQVTFKKGGTACADATQIQAGATPNSMGKVTYSASFAASASPITIRACYGGSSSPVLGASETALVQNVNRANTSASVAGVPNPSVFSQTVVFTVTVVAVAPGAGIPQGMVTLKDGTCALGTPLATSGLDGTGKAAFNVNTLNAGAHTIGACYAGDDDYNGDDASVSHTVNKAETSTQVLSSANPSVFSQTVTFSVTVTPDAPAVATPVGNVTLKNGTCVSGTVLGGPTALDGSGEVSFSLSTLAVGTHTISACYGGNANFEASDDNVSQVVNKAPTATTVLSSANPSVFSQSVTFSVTVSAVAPAVATPVGDVTLMNGTCSGGTSLGGPTAVNGSGQVSFNVSTLAVGTHTITACYAGNASFEASDGNVSQVVNKAVTSTAILSSVNPSILAQPVTFSVTVSPVAPAVATPAGNVTLKDGTCVAGSPIGGPTALNGSGQASFNVSTLAVGSHTITACYAGNVSFEPSENFLSQQVKYNFEGLFAPVDRPNTMNVSKAGQAVPLKWRLTDYNGAPVLNFSPAALGVAVSGLQCTISTTLDQIEEYAGNSGLQNQGDGYYQFNWKSPASYVNSCKAIGLNLGEGVPRGPLAYFNFKK